MTILPRAGIVRTGYPRIRDAWVASGFDYCFLCGVPDNAPDYLGNVLHHIVGGAARSHEPANFARLCQSRCHAVYHGDTVKIDGKPLERVTLAHVLWAKRRCDPAHFDPARLAILRGAPLPEPMEPPAWCRAMWALWLKYNVRRGAVILTEDRP